MKGGLKEGERVKVGGQESNVMVGRMAKEGQELLRLIHLNWKVRVTRKEEEMRKTERIALSGTDDMHNE